MFLQFIAFSYAVMSQVVSHEVVSSTKRVAFGGGRRSDSLFHGRNYVACLVPDFHEWGWPWVTVQQSAAGSYHVFSYGVYCRLTFDDVDNDLFGNMGHKLHVRLSSVYQHPPSNEGWPFKRRAQHYHFEAVL